MGGSANSAPRISESSSRSPLDFWIFTFEIEPPASIQIPTRAV